MSVAPAESCIHIINEPSELPSDELPSKPVLPALKAYIAGSLLIPYLRTGNYLIEKALNSPSCDDAVPEYHKNDRHWLNVLGPDGHLFRRGVFHEKDPSGNQAMLHRYNDALYRCGLKPQLRIKGNDRDLQGNGRWTIDVPLTPQLDALMQAYFETDDAIVFTVAESMGPFLRGMFDQFGYFKNDGEFTCVIIVGNSGTVEEYDRALGASPSEAGCLQRELVKRFPFFSCGPAHDEVMVTGVNAIDILGKMYHDLPADALRCQWRMNDALRHIKAYFTPPGILTCRIIKTLPDAIVPCKASLTDVGYDLTIIKLHKHVMCRYGQLGEPIFITSLYDTGLVLGESPMGYYAEIVPRSSLVKSGYMLANSVGIIDPTYRGPLLIAVTKVHENVADLVLPFRCCQLIFRKQVHVELECVTQNEGTAATVRNQGGFGSTG